MRYILLLILSVCLISCQAPNQQQSETPLSQTEIIAQQVVEASGGLDNWNKAKNFTWIFFDRRRNTWNKQTGDFRTDFLDDSLTICYNLNTQKGSAWIKGEPVAQDTLAHYLDIANQVWCNDAYWVFMPFKLTDKGVALEYLGVDTNTSVIGHSKATPSHVLSLTFDSVGYTPQNKYHVYVDTNTHLVNQWVFFQNDSSRVFENTWADYKKVGGLNLAQYRSEKWKITELIHFDSLPEWVYNSSKEFQPKVWVE